FSKRLLFAAGEQHEHHRRGRVGTDGEVDATGHRGGAERQWPPGPHGEPGDLVSRVRVDTLGQLPRAYPGGQRRPGCPAHADSASTPAAPVSATAKKSRKPVAVMTARTSAGTPASASRAPFRSACRQTRSRTRSPAPDMHDIRLRSSRTRVRP